MRSKDEALLLSKLVIPSNISDLVNINSSSDLKLSQFSLIKVDMSSSVGQTVTGGDKSAAKCCRHFSGLINVASSETVLSKDPSLNDFTKFIYPRGLVLCKLSKSTKSLLIYSLCLVFRSLLYCFVSD